MVNSEYGFDTTGMSQEEIEELVREYDKEEYQRAFIDTLIGNTDELLKDIEEKKHLIEQKINKYEQEKDAAKVTLYKAIHDMVNSIGTSDLYHLMELNKEDGWTYELSFSTGGIELYVTQFIIPESDEDSLTGFIAFSKTLVKANVLSVSDYAKKYGVEPVTVRQWIRRGKLRNARKHGSEWFIPELDVPNTDTHYQSVTYHFKDKLTNVPEYLSYLEGHQSVHISQNEEDRKQFEVLFWDDEEGVPPIIMTTKEREKLEYFLLGHPNVYAGDQMISIY